MTFHLLASYSLIAANRAALCITVSVLSFLNPPSNSSPHPRQNRRNAYPAVLLVHFEGNTKINLHTLYQCFLTLPSVRFGNVFVTSSCQYENLDHTLGLYLCYLAPAVPRISHRLQSLLLGRAPWRVCPTLLRRWC